MGEDELGFEDELLGGGGEADEDELDPGALRGGNDQWGGKQFGIIAINLFDHFLVARRGGKIRAGADLSDEGVDLMLEDVQLHFFAVVIESLACWCDGRDPQGLAHLIEDWAVGFQMIERVLQSAIVR